MESKKRPRDTATRDLTPSSKKLPSTLSNWLSHLPRMPSPLVHSSPITDRSSTFVAHATTCTSAPAAADFHLYIRALSAPSHPQPADHEIMAWRSIVLRVGKTGLEGEDAFTVRTGSEDDGEKNGGNTLKKCLEEEGAVDVVVVVSRYYGGIMLGPDRFTHMRTVTKQALDLLNTTLLLPDLISSLKFLDVKIAALTPSFSTTTSPAKPPPNYDDDKTLTLEKAERLIRAREKRLEFLKAKVEAESLKSADDDTWPRLSSSGVLLVNLITAWDATTPITQEPNLQCSPTQTDTQFDSFHPLEA